MNYTTLVSTEVLAMHLDDPDWVIFDCRFTLTDTEAGRRLYEEGHIPGSHYVHLDNDLSSPVRADTGRHPLPDVKSLSEKLAHWGVGEGKQVVVYDDAFGAMACRMWWLLRWLGHENVALLDGVYPKWVREKRPITTSISQPVPGQFIPHPDNSMWISTADLQAELQNSDVLLIDARAEERFSGEVEPLDRVAGHIPGAVNRPYDDNLDFSGDLLGAEELNEEYREKLNGRLPREVIHMCGSGVTACHNILAMELAGLNGSRLYAGSWSEWISDDRRPVATGED